MAGLDVVADAGELRSRIDLAGQYAAVDENLTGRENLEMVGRLYHFPAAESRSRANELLGRFELTDAATRLAKTYSGGMRRRLDLAAALVARPPVLFLDEPTRARRGRGGGGVSALAYAISDTAVVARRNLLRIPRQPAALAGTPASQTTSARG